MSEERTPAEIYSEVLESNNDPNFYGRIPQSIFWSTYIDLDKNNVPVRKKLSPHAVALFGFLTNVSGKECRSYYSTRTLAEIIGVSTSTISKAKKELSKPIEQLNGKSFITIKKKKRLHKESSGSVFYDQIHMNHIWPENAAFMAIRKDWVEPPIPQKEEQPEKATCSHSEQATPTCSHSEQALPGASSLCERNNSNRKKTHPVRVTDKAASTASAMAADATSVCEPIKGDSVSGKDYGQTKDFAHQCLVKFGCDENFIKEVLREYSPKVIINAGKYTTNQMKRKVIKNKFGYFRNALRNKLVWEDKDVSQMYR